MVTEGESTPYLNLPIRQIEAALLRSLETGFGLGRYPIPDLILYFHPQEGLTDLKYYFFLISWVQNVTHRDFTPVSQHGYSEIITRQTSYFSFNMSSFGVEYLLTGDFDLDFYTINH
jgi:hypothetical protein